MPNAPHAFADLGRFAQFLRCRFEVPSTIFWYVIGDKYLGRLVARNDLTPWLAEAGGHVSWHIVPSRQRQRQTTRIESHGASRERA